MQGDVMNFRFLIADFRFEILPRSLRISASLGHSESGFVNKQYNFWTTLNLDH